MNIKRNIILAYTKRLTFALVLFAMVVQPLIETIVLLSESSYELVTADVELDIDGEEKQEEDSKDEKEEILLINSYCRHTCDSYNNTSYLYHSSLNSNFNIKINTPPPEFG